jgi:hypothetical protein
LTRPAPNSARFSLDPVFPTFQANRSPPQIAHRCCAAKLQKGLFRSKVVKPLGFSEGRRTAEAEDDNRYVIEFPA